MQVSKGDLSISFFFFFKVFSHHLLSKICFNSFDLLNIERNPGTHELQQHLEVTCLQEQLCPASGCRALCSADVAASLGHLVTG